MEQDLGIRPVERASSRRSPGFGGLPVDPSLGRDRLVEELVEANRRLSGTLRIVLDTLDHTDVDELFSQVIEELADTLGASGAILYLSEPDGLRLHGATESLDGARIPSFVPREVDVLGMGSGRSLGLHLVAIDKDELREGPVSSRLVENDATGERRRVPARYLPPFSSLIMVPVWFGRHVIAVILVGWQRPHALRKADGELLDAVAQYLSIQLMGAVTTLRNERAARNDRVAERVLSDFSRSEGPLVDRLHQALLASCDGIGAAFAPIREDDHASVARVMLPGLGERPLGVPLDEVLPGRHADATDLVRCDAMSDGPALELSCWLSSLGLPSRALLVDMGELWGERRCFLALRDAEGERFDGADLALMRRVGDGLREAGEDEATEAQDKHIAQALQAGMRSSLQEVEGITAEGVYSSATADAFVGGDFYDLVRLPGRRCCVIMGDVSGKGVEAASVSAAVRTALGAYAWQGLSPSRMVRTLNGFLLGFSRVETFATLFVGLVDLDHATLTYCSAGHPPALFLRARTGELESLDVQSGVVGAFEDMRYRDGRLAIERGDLLLLYTDGVTEARDPQGSFFGEEGLRETVLSERLAGTRGLIGRILDGLDAFTGNSLEDDVALVSLVFDEVG